jgi:hypothetical protein
MAELHRDEYAVSDYTPAITALAVGWLLIRAGAWLRKVDNALAELPDA